MILEVAREKTWVPTFNGNDKADEADKVRFVHRFLSPSERRKYYNWHNLDENNKVRPHIDITGHAQAVLTRVENLTLKVDGTEKVIKGAKDLYETPGIPQSLIEEWEAYIVGADPQVDTDPLP